MSIAAGSSSHPASTDARKRRNIQGHTVVADLALLAKLRRFPSATLLNCFRQAREQGSAPIQIDDASYILQRHSDHTFSIDLRDERHHPVL